MTNETTLQQVLERVLSDWESLADLTHGRLHNLGLGLRECREEPCRRVNAFRSQLPELVAQYSPDDVFADATVMAHPAWWRGYQYAVLLCAQMLAERFPKARAAWQEVSGLVEMDDATPPAVAPATGARAA